MQSSLTVGRSQPETMPNLEHDPELHLHEHALGIDGVRLVWVDITTKDINSNGVYLEAVRHTLR